MSVPSLAKEQSWDVDGIKRVGLVYAPDTALQVPSPVVFAFHGHGGTMQHAARTFGYQRHWPEAMVIYLQGLNTPGRLTDPEGKKTGWQHGPGAEQDRDLKFFDVVLAQLKKEYKVDEDRIYATGHSNGGAFTYLLWSQRGDIFAAVAPSAATARSELNTMQPKPALHVGGENDNLVRWPWQKRTIEAVRELNRCDATGQPWETKDELFGTIYPSQHGTPLVTLISKGDHKFPDAAPPMIVKFFQAHRKLPSKISR